MSLATADALMGIFGMKRVCEPGDARIFAIDPGTTKSGWCVLRGSCLIESGVDTNDDLLRKIIAGYFTAHVMAVGKEVFDTCVWIGRFKQAWANPEKVILIYRRDVKLHLCGNVRAKDTNIRQAIIDAYGGKEKAVGKKANPGELYGVKSHAWPALAVALTAAAQ